MYNIWNCIYIFQYLKPLHPIAHHVLERFALLLCIGLVWVFAAILTAAGAYDNVKQQTKLSCRTDRSFLVSSAPWYVQIMSVMLPNEVMFLLGNYFYWQYMVLFQYRIRIPYPFQWGTPIFKASHVFGMMGAALVASAEVYSLSIEFQHQFTWKYWKILFFARLFLNISDTLWNFWTRF